MICVTIQILDVPEWLPDRIANASSSLYLDTDEKTQLALDETLEELSELNEIARQENVPIQLPSTPKNDAILGNILNPNADQFGNKPLRVLGMWGCEPMEQSYLYVTENLGNEGYVCILLADDHWLQLASRKYLNTIDYGTFEYTRSNIRSTFTNERYDTGHVGYYFPVINYGGLNKKAYITVRYMRPWFHVYGVLQKGFKEIGYKFVCPLLETEVGRRLISYILREDFINEIATSYELNAILPLVTNPQNDSYANRRRFKGSSIVKYGFDSSNPDNPYMAENTGKFTGCLFGDFSARIILAKTGEGVGKLVTTKLVALYTTGHEEVLSEASTEIKDLGPFTGPTEMKHTATNFQMDSGMTMFVRIECEDPDVEVVISYAELKIDNTIYPCVEEGQEIVLNTMINADDTLLDKLKGVAHLFEGKFETDHNLRIVTMYTPYDVDYYGEEVEGFYSDALPIIDINKKIQANSIKVIAPKIDLEKRFRSYEFATSKDKYILSQSYITKDFPLFAVKVDLGGEYKEGLLKQTNPYYEPTLSGSISPIVSAGAGSYSETEVAFCIDNEEDRESYDIGRRILYTPGMCKLYNANDKVTKMDFFGYNGDEEMIPVAWQKSFYKHQVNGEGAIIENDVFIGYGDRFAEDKSRTHYEKFIKRFLANRKQNLKVEALVFMSQNMYMNRSFRSAHMFSQQDYIVVGYLQKYSDFQLCSDYSTPMVFLPDRDSIICGDSIIPPPTNFQPSGCGTDWQIISEKIGCCYFIDINYVGIITTNFQGGSNEPNPTVIIEYILINGQEWMPYDDNTGICSPVANFIVRAKIQDILPCPDVIKFLPVNVCNDSWEPFIEFIQTIEDGQNCYELAIGGMDAAEIDSIVWTVKEDGVVVPYTGKKCGTFTEVCAEAVVTPLCGCSVINLDEVCKVFPPLNPDCSLNAATLECVDDGNGCFTVVSGGVFAAVPGIDIVMYSCDDGDTWTIWDGVTAICCANVRFKRWINFCGGVCEPICVEAICECTQFDAGVSANVAVCNNGYIN